MFLLLRFPLVKEGEGAFLSVTREEWSNPAIDKFPYFVPESKRTFMTKSTKSLPEIFFASFWYLYPSRFSKSQKLLPMVVKQFVILYGNLRRQIRKTHIRRKPLETPSPANILVFFFFRNLKKQKIVPELLNGILLVTGLLRIRSQWQVPRHPKRVLHDFSFARDYREKSKKSRKISSRINIWHMYVSLIMILGKRGKTSSFACDIISICFASCR